MEEIDEIRLEKSPGALQAYKILQIEQIPSIEKLPSKSSQSNKESPKELRDPSSGANSQQFPTTNLHQSENNSAQQSQSKARLTEDAISD